ncbi:[FeFe] hydrogenase H-cluster maturation GTPase HydF [Sporosalibacterium faouarense]|uniref:[FeFe] hydrogenase H-cluster maturation GTPase HydF n=1 Tax=Sporosalibacterium faouarense TaxID=516123 RepID=UPI00141CC5F2|nr:[FeFe] hydrogenase H-cluster maturation GTPase HydF [Sporosalibacterium faouarense]MTI49799.1 [FeFe] hydrogenase H-cluster maturation GTPase HydF [Bacillota bacterium]
MNNTPRANRPHIAIFGRRNAGKSSLINAITNQDIALVSETKGTTTDPVYKSMEILPLGPVVLIDTAGIDDEGELGELRVKKTLTVLDKTDLAILLIDVHAENLGFEEEIIKIIDKKGIPLIGVINKIDLTENEIDKYNSTLNINFIPVSAKTGEGITELKNKIAKKAENIDFEEPAIIGDLINRFDVILHVVPIDDAAPKGRLILPQVQTIRDVLDHNGINIVVQDTELEETIKMFRDKIKIVVTDSQAFGKIRDIVPNDIYLTSYSILYARYKGELNELVRGAKAVKSLEENDLVLISESCTHHRQKGDIGRDKIPRFLQELSNNKLNFEWSSGTTIPNDLSKYSMIVHCGGCMINRKQMLSRINKAKEGNIPIVNYGVFLGMKFEVLDRALDLFPEAKEIWNK